MNDTPHPEFDPVDHWLAGPPARALPDGLEQTVLQRTRRVLRRRRWLRRTGYAAALAACYAAGLLTMKVLPPAPPSPPAVVVRTDPEPQPRITAPKEEATPAGPAGAEPASALALEWQAVDSPEKRPDLYRRAGDRYLEEGDYQSAVRCYRNLLEAAPAEAMTFSATNNWLLMALIDAKSKEKRRGKTDG